jgi:hypothetical protein
VTETSTAGSTGEGSTPDLADTGQFELVDANGNPVDLTSSFSNATIDLGAQNTATDPFYDAYDSTLGGGDSGSIMISRYIKPGTVSAVDYNHYSLLRSLEDMFQVASGSGSASGYTGSVNISTGLDGDGHIGYAAQPGLAPFGRDVFTNPSGDR